MTATSGTRSRRGVTGSARVNMSPLPRIDRCHATTLWYNAGMGTFLLVGAVTLLSFAVLAIINRTLDSLD